MSDKTPIEFSADSSAENNTKTIELIYALPQTQNLVTIEIASDCTVGQAITQSKILDLYPEIDLEVNKVGIFSKVCKLDDQLYDGDRIEIYRPLIADPKEVRKKRAIKQQEKT